MRQANGEPSLKRRTLANMVLTASARIITLALQLAANVILARNLSAVDYGIVGYAQIFISFLSLVSEFGLNSAAIQSPRFTQAMLQTGFTLRMLLGLAAFGLALIAAPWCADLLGEQAAGDVIKLLAVGFLINGMAFMPTVQILRALDYRKFVGGQVAGAVVNSVVTVTMALNGFAYWSIVVANVAAIAASTLVLNAMVKERPQFTLEPQSVGHYVNFGGHLFMSSVLTFIIMNLDNFAVGTLLGSSALGYYVLAFTWGTKFCETLASVVNSVLFPTFAKIQADIPRLRSAYLKSLELVGFIAVGGYVGLVVVSDDFLIHVLGAGTDKWLPSLTVLRILCLYGLIRALLEPIGSVIMAVGGIPVLVRANLLAAVVMAVLIKPVLAVFGVEGVAVVVTLSYACQYLIFLPALKYRLSVSPREFLNPLRQPLIAGAFTLTTLALIRSTVTLGQGQERFWLSALLSGAIYIAVFGLLSRGSAYRELYNLIRVPQRHD